MNIFKRLLKVTASPQSTPPSFEAVNTNLLDVTSQMLNASTAYRTDRTENTSK